MLVFGESLGAWASSDVIMKLGVEGLDHYGVERALWFGMPQLARWSAAGLDRPGQLTPEGTVGVFDRWEELEQLSPEERDAAAHRAAQPRQRPHHADDARRCCTGHPDWLGEPRGRNVPEGQRWYPIVTGVQTMIDAANAMRNSPGEFRSTGHDYRADTARFVAEGYRLRLHRGAAGQRSRRRCASSSVEREARIKPPPDTAEVTPAPAQRTEHHLHAPHLPKLHGHRTKGANWVGDVAELSRSATRTGSELIDRPVTGPTSGPHGRPAAQATRSRDARSGRYTASCRPASTPWR